MSISRRYFECCDEQGSSRQFREYSVLDAKRAAYAWMSEASFDTSAGTVWYHATLFELEMEPNEDGDMEETGREEVARLTYDFDPPEPDCACGHEHDWRSPYSVVGGLEENPGVWGHGGGAITTEVCCHCGAYRITDTWAQDPETGQEGLEAVSYEDPNDASIGWVQRRAQRQDAE